MDDISKSFKSQEKSVISYAIGVFKESTIGMVASIVTTGSPARKWFKSIILMLCISGFLYQCITYLIHVLEFPTVVRSEVKTNKSYDLPAFTFCNNNGMNRDIFCSMYPDRCSKVDQKFCSFYPTYCEGNKTLAPKAKYYNVEETMTYDEILKYGHNLYEFLMLNRSRIFFEECLSESPFIRFKHQQETAMVCYSLCSVVGTENYPQKQSHMSYPDGWIAPAHELVFFIDGKEMFIPGNHPGVLFTISSPYEAVNPFDKSIFLQPGRAYKIYVSMTEEILLKTPYDTDCVNYSEIWEANNRRGSRIREMCEQKCVLEYSLDCANCSLPYVLYPNKHRKCNKEDLLTYYDCYRKDSSKRNGLEECKGNCKDDCRITRYSYKVLEMFDLDYDDGKDVLDEQKYITVHIHYDDEKITTMTHSPKYMSVEVFSAIGGFSGVWLGISLMDVIDVFASAFQVSRYAFRNRRNGHITVHV